MALKEVHVKLLYILCHVLHPDHVHMSMHAVCNSASKSGYARKSSSLLSPSIASPDSSWDDTSLTLGMLTLAVRLGRADCEACMKMFC